eukprot:COSAG04_NODE_254_length_18809_cov_8.025869_5_plen_85_part_00
MPSGQPLRARSVDTCIASLACVSSEDFREQPPVAPVYPRALLAGRAVLVPRAWVVGEAAGDALLPPGSPGKRGATARRPALRAA